MKLLEDETGSVKTGTADGADLVYKIVSQMPEICKALFSGATLNEWQEGYRSGRTRPGDLLEIVNSGSRDPGDILAVIQ